MALVLHLLVACVVLIENMPAFKTHYKTYQPNSEINLLAILMGKYRSVCRPSHNGCNKSWLAECACKHVCFGMLCQIPASLYQPRHTIDAIFSATLMNNNNFCSSLYTQIKLSLSFYPATDHHILSICSRLHLLLNQLMCLRRNSWLNWCMSIRTVLGRAGILHFHKQFRHRLNTTCSSLVKRYTVN